MLHQQVLGRLAAVFCYPTAALKMFRPAVADHRTCSPAAHEGFAYLLAVLLVIIALAAGRVEIDAFHYQVVR